MFSSQSYAKWTKVGQSVIGNSHYVDFESITKHGGYVYFWDMLNYLKPSNGLLSIKEYKEGDCKLLRYKSLSMSFHKAPMGGGTGEPYNIEDSKWIYATPNSMSEIILKTICNP